MLGMLSVLERLMVKIMLLLGSAWYANLPEPKATNEAANTAVVQEVNILSCNAFLPYKKDSTYRTTVSPPTLIIRSKNPH